MLKKFKVEIKKERKYIIETLGRFVAVPTLSNPGLNYKLMVNILEKECKKLGLITKQFLVKDKKFLKTIPAENQKYPRWILMAHWNTGAKKTLHFNGHFDVVPASNGFTGDPFKLRVKKDVLIGRGTADMKGSIVAMLLAVKILKKLGVKPAWNLEFSFVPDEEISGQCGSGYLCHKKIPKADVVIEGDGGGGNVLTVAHRGIVNFDVTVHGKPAHAGRHTDGVNAFLKAIKIVEELEKFRKILEKRKTKYKTDKWISSVATMMIGGVTEGGIKSNAVPDKFMFTIDRRILPEENIVKARNEIVKLIQNVAKKDGTFKVSIKTEDIISGSIPTTAPICTLLAGILKEFYGKTPEMILTGGRLDSALFSTVLKKPAVAYGISGKNIHGDDECTTVGNISDTASIFAELMIKAN